MLCTNLKLAVFASLLLLATALTGEGHPRENTKPGDDIADLRTQS